MDDITASQDTVYAVAASADFAQGGACFVARTSGLYRSFDGGISWQFAYAELQLQADLVTSAVALSPDFPRDRTVFAGGSGGVLRSYDAGQSWHVSLLPSPPCVVSCLVFSPNYTLDGIVFAGALADGVYRSADRGQSWARWNFGLFDLRVLALTISTDFATDEALYAGTESGIYLSQNGGRSWRAVAFHDDLAPVLSLGFVHSHMLLAGTESHGLWRSADQGRTWQRCADEWMTESVNALIVSPAQDTRPPVLALASEGCFISEDGDTRWAAQGFADRPEAELTACAAPSGLMRGAAALVGLADGRAFWTSLL